MTTETQRRQSRFSRKLSTKTIDRIALGTALSWGAAMVGFSLRDGETSLLVWLMRGMWGAVFIYAATFVALHTAGMKEDSSGKKRSPATKSADALAKTTADLQAADSGKLAEVIKNNATK